MRDIDKYLGRKVRVKYIDDEDDFIYEGIISGYSSLNKELILGLDGPQNGEKGWKNSSSLNIIQHPKPIYFWAYEEDTEIEIIG